MNQSALSEDGHDPTSTQTNKTQTAGWQDDGSLGNALAWKACPEFSSLHPHKGERKGSGLQSYLLTIMTYVAAHMNTHTCVCVFTHMHTTNTPFVSNAIIQ